jgi:tetratricopeptide (TPR) repeat protein
MESFCSLLTMVQELFPNREFEIMNEYIRSLDPNKKTARICLEYTQVNKQLKETHDYLLEALSNCSNKESNEMAKVYQIDNDVANGKIKPLEGITIFQSIKLKYPEAIAFATIGRYYIYHDLSLIDSMSLLEPIIEINIANVEGAFLKNSYEMRLNAITSAVNLHKNNINHVRSRTDKIEECMNEYYKASKYITLGNSYTFESYDKAMEYFNKSLDIAVKNDYINRIIQAKRSINFIQNYWGHFPQYLDENSSETSDLHELSAYYVNIRDEKKALEILNKINIDEMTDLSKGFHFYYRGIATKSKEMFFKSLKHFNISGEQFYKNLPIIELKKMGIEDYILDAFMN